MRVVVVEQGEEVGRPLCPLRLHLHPIGRHGEDEKKRASPDYENANGPVDVQRDPGRRCCEGGDRFVNGAEPKCPCVFWLGTTCTEGLIGRPPGPAAAPAPTAAPGAFPALPGPDIVEPAAAAATATAPAAFAETAGMAVFDAEIENCFALFVEIKDEDL